MSYWKRSRSPLDQQQQQQYATIPHQQPTQQRTQQQQRNFTPRFLSSSSSSKNKPLPSDPMNVHSISAFGNEHGDGAEGAEIPDIPMRKSSRHLSVSDFITSPPLKSFRNKPRFVEDVDSKPTNQNSTQQQQQQQSTAGTAGTAGIERPMR